MKRRAIVLALVGAMLAQGGGDPVFAQGGATPGPADRSAVSLMSICADIWATKSAAELNSYAEETNGRLDTADGILQYALNVHAADLQSARAEMDRLDAALNSKIADLAMEGGKTGLQLPASAAELKQVQAALQANAEVEGATTQLNQATANYDKLRDEHMAAIVALQANEAIRAGIDSCIRDQQQYLGQTAAANAMPSVNAANAAPVGDDDYAQARAYCQPITPAGDDHDTLEKLCEDSFVQALHGH